MIFNVEKDAKRKKIPGSREKVKHSIDNIDDVKYIGCPDKVSTEN